MRKRRKIVGIILSLLMCTSTVVMLPADAPSTTSFDTTYRIDQEQLWLWLDGFIEGQLRTLRIPGAAVAIVSSDEIILVEGYGDANPVDGTPVDAATTQFRIASITKTFTWAMLLELAADNRISLSEEIEPLLGDLVPPVVQGSNITVVDLLTHTAGFEERQYGMFDPPEEDIAPLSTWIMAYPMQTAWPHGTVQAYSNYGAALGGFLVQQLTGKSWERNLYDRILEPAGMTDTLVTAQPAEWRLRDFSPGWYWDEGEWQEVPFLPMNGAPAASISSTAADMARWLMILLRDGSIKGRSVLQPETVARLTEPLREYTDGFPPYYHGLYAIPHKSETIIAHGGSFNDHSSILAIFPERHIGLFAVYNSDRWSATENVLEAFADRLYHMMGPVASPEVLSVWVDPGDIAHDHGGLAVRDLKRRLNGYYNYARSSFSNWEKIDSLNDQCRVRILDDGTLHVKWTDGFEEEFLRIGPRLWTSASGGTRVAAVIPDNGPPSLVLNTYGPWSIVKIGGLSAPFLSDIPWMVSVAALLAVLILMPAIRLMGYRSCDSELRSVRIPIRISMWIVALSATPGSILIADTVWGGGNPDIEVVSFVLWSNATFASLLFVFVVLLVMVHRRQATLRRRIPPTTWIWSAVMLGHVAFLLYWNQMPWKLEV